MRKNHDIPESEGRRLAPRELDYKRLAQAVILDAAKAAKAGDNTALQWLEDAETADTFGVLAGVRWSAVLAWCRRQTLKANRSQTPTRRHQEGHRDAAARKT